MKKIDNRKKNQNNYMIVYKDIALNTNKKEK